MPPLLTLGKWYLIALAVPFCLCVVAELGQQQQSLEMIHPFLQGVNQWSTQILGWAISPFYILGYKLPLEFVRHLPRIIEWLMDRMVDLLNWLDRACRFCWEHLIEPIFRFVMITLPRWLGEKLVHLMRQIWDYLLKPIIRFVFVTLPEKLLNLMRQLWNHLLEPIVRFFLITLPEKLYYLCRDLIELAWRHLFQPIWNLCHRLITYLWENLTAVLEYFLLTLPRMFGQAIMRVIENLGRILSYIWHLFLDWLVWPIWSVVKTVGGKIWDLVSMIGGNLWSFIKEISFTVWQVVIKIGPVLWQVITTIGNQTWNIMANVGNAVYNVVTEVLSAVTTSVWNICVAMATTVQEVLTAMLETMSRVLSFSK